MMTKRTLAKTLIFTRALLGTNLRSALALRASFWLQVSFMALNNLTFFVFWWVLFARVPTLRGWGLADVYALFGISAVAFGLIQCTFGGVRHLGRLIDEGELDSMLTQPKPVLLYALGSRSHPSGLGDVLSGFGLLLCSGYVRWQTLPVVLFSILAAAATFLGIGIAFFSLAFWLRRSESLARELWNVTITLTLYPEPIFGRGLRIVLYTLLPAGFVSYLPVRLLREPCAGDALLLLCGSALQLAFGVYVFERGRRRYASGSRFGVFG